MKVTLVDYMGSDLSVVNAARVSFDRQSEMLVDRDERLIAYLAKHGHWTPFAHPQIQFRISAPIFVARQLGKHQVGLVWNEISRRYVSTTPTLYSPPEWREKPSDRKQGSGKDIIALPVGDRDDLNNLQTTALELYERLIKKGIAPEQARMVLPQSMYTEWYWTGSLYAFSRIYNLRTSETAQYETRLVIEQLGEEIAKHFSVSWQCLTEGDTPEVDKDQTSDQEQIDSTQNIENEG